MASEELLGKLKRAGLTGTSLTGSGPRPAPPSRLPALTRRLLLLVLHGAISVSPLAGPASVSPVHALARVPPPAHVYSWVLQASALLSPTSIFVCFNMILCIFIENGK